MRCPQGHDNRSDASFCIECGARIVAACANCGRELPASARFCDGCGTALQAAPAAEGKPPAVDSGYAPPPHLAAKILRDRAALEGERRNITVLFIDAVGSTSTSEKIDPEELHSIVRACTDRMIEAVNRFEGTVTQFRGDGIMAIFGAPIAHEDSARRAVAAALAMRDTLIGYASELRAQGRPSFRYRIGLNTGPVVVGTIGNDLTMDYTAVGDTVNLAARMEQWATPGSVYITENTHRHVAAYFELEDLGLLEVKGKAEGVHVYEVTRELSARTRLDASVERGLTPYVGRRDQVELLRSHFEHARAGMGQVVFVTGEAGMGKSRLLLEFRRSLGNDARWLEGRCISWGRNFPYLPIVDIVRRVFGVGEGDDDQRVVALVDEGVARWGYVGAQSAAYLKCLLNVDTADDGVTTMDPVARQKHMLDALRVLLVNEASRRPLVIVVEDLHWVDEQSEEAMMALIDAAASAPVMLIITSRPGYAHSFGDRTYYARLALRNLSQEACAAMVERLLDAPGLPLRLCEMIVAKTEGNPFFIEEVSRSLLDSGVLRRRNGTYELARPVEQVTIPDTIQEVILSRLDRLERGAKEAVQYASVIGREFPVRLLKHITSAEAGMDDLLAELKSLELIYEKSYFPEVEYMFKHALTQEVALSTLLAERRRALHRTVAGAIEELYADRLSEHYESLAHHYFHGEDWQKALDYERRVAERAQAVYAPRAAIEHFTRAIDAAMHLPDPRDPALYRARGRAYEAVGEFERAREDYEAAIGAAAALGDARAEWQAHADLGMLWAGRDYDRTGEHVSRAYDIARALDDEPLIARSLNRLGNWALNTGHPLECIQRHEEALEMFRRLGDKRGIAESVDFLQMGAALAGDMKRARAYGDEGIALWRELGDRQALANLLASTSFTALNIETYAVVALDFGRQDPRSYAEEALQIAREIGWRGGEAYALMHRAMHSAGVGDSVSAIADAELALSIAEEIGHEQWQLAALLTLSSVHYDLGDADTALVFVERALQHAREARSAHWIGCAVGQKALMLAETGHTREARQALERDLTPDLPMISIGERSLWTAKAITELQEGNYRAAINVVDALDRSAKNRDDRSLRLMPMLAWIRGRAYAATGRIDAAAADLEAARSGAEMFQARPLLWRIYASIGDLRLATGRADLAREAYGAALALVEELAAPLTDSALRDAFLSSPVVRRLHETSV